MEIKSYFQSKEGSVVRLSEIYYINYTHMTVNLNSNKIITFHSEEKECFKQLVEAYKKFRDTIDIYESELKDLEMKILKERML